MTGHPLKKWSVILVTLAAVLGIMVPVGPAAAIDLDGITVTPIAGYKGEYDDNVFRAGRGNRKDDYVNTIYAGVTVSAKPEKKHDVMAGYKIDVLRYSNNNNLDTERHNAFLKFGLNFNRAQFRFSEDFRHTDEFPTTEDTRRIRRNTNDLGAGFDFDMAQIWGIGFDYLWEYNNYLEAALDNLDRNRHTLAPAVYYKLTGKTKAFLEYNYAHEVFDISKSRDNTVHRVLIGLRGDITERFKLTGKVGWQGLGYTANTFNDHDSMVASIQADYQPAERLGMSLLLKRYTDVSTFGTNGHYDAMTANFSVNYNFTPKITVMPRVSLGWNSYPEEVANASSNNALEQRDDLDLGAGIGLRWDPVKWGKLELGYDFVNRSSNFDAVEYIDNRVSFTIGFQM